ncbi:hypothetical protein F2Q69_00020995 [Brassica cretica]|uniref:RNase H type-1 domain-containing protein n=1 Tax=Brassica cretica TaxID=69181 RepID=A0A8S9Q2J4_BRACR|nr:hypothetical protein F2Q69_00020995 [Brassica cretica]
MKGPRLGGGAWVLRDEKGKVILHGRRAFSEIGSFHDAKLQVLVWLVESIISHHQNKVIFALDDGDITQMEERANNRGALLIVKGVTKGRQTQSYVVAEPSAWLLGCFENEEVSSSA